MDVAFQFFIGVDLHALREILVRVDVSEVMQTSPLRILGTRHKVAEHLTLQSLCLGGIMRDSLLATGEIELI